MGKPGDIAGRKRRYRRARAGISPDTGGDIPARASPLIPLYSGKDTENTRMNGKNRCQCDTKALTLQVFAGNAPFWQTFCTGKNIRKCKNTNNDMDKKEKMDKQKEELKVQNESEETKTSDEKVEEQEVPQSEEQKLADELQKAKEMIEEQKDKYLRLSAEFDNYRKRTMKEKAELILNGGEKSISSILPIVDDLERALKNMETATDVKAVKEGVELIYNKFMTVLNQNGVKVIETQDQPLNTDFHEAIAVIPAPEEGKKGKILDCVQTGYTLNDKVIRHAKVVVGE